MEKFVDFGKHSFNKFTLCPIKTNKDIFESLTDSLLKKSATLINYSLPINFISSKDKYNYWFFLIRDVKKCTILMLFCWSDRFRY